MNYEYVNTGMEINEYTILDQNEIFKKMDKNDNYKYDEDEHKDEELNLYVKKYSTFKTSCQKDHTISDYHTFIGHTEKIHSSFLAILILQIILGSINLIWIFFMLLNTNCTRNKPKYGWWRKAVFVKIGLTFLISLGCIIASIISYSARENLPAERVDYFKDESCFVDYIQQEMDKFHTVYFDLDFILTMFVSFSVIQNLYEAGLYPGIKALDKCV